MNLETKMLKLKLDSIRIDGGTQSRAELDDDAVTDYAAIIRDGTDFPPVIVFNDGKHNWLADGFHRWHAYRSAGATEIAADVRKGTKRDAKLFSAGANTDHGLRRTNADKRSAVMVLLSDKEWAKWSDREIAKQCGVSDRFVNGLRGDTANRSQSERSFTHPKTGKTATMDTANIGKSKPSQEQQAEVDSARAETAAQFSPEVQEHRARTEEYRAQAKSEKAKAPGDIEALRAELEEKSEYIASLEVENADLKRKIVKFDDMVIQYEQGGFEKVIAGKDEEIRVLETRLYAESADKASWVKLSKAKDKSIAFYKVEAEKRGYSDDAKNQGNSEAGEAYDEFAIF
jgi:hypothetical protein